MSELLKINVNEHTEKKGQLTYLSWAWAWAEVLKIDPGATWVVHKYGNPEQPCMWIGETAMVHTSVTVKGLTRECMLPVMDHKNNALKNPDARKISDAIMRCMTKAISMHGLGLYIYAGEDLPESDSPEPKADPETNQHGKKVDRTLVMKTARAIAEHVAAGHDLGALQEWEEAQATGEEFAGDVWSRLTTPERDKLRELQTAAAVTPERAKVLKDEVRRIVAACRGLRTDSALEVYDKITDRREREYVWRELDSEPKVQDIITAAYEARKQPA